jgi:pyridoxamine 5'-phosphate oxidase
MNDALKANLSDPSAMSLATVNADGQSWQRTVLLKNFDKNGFIFYTNLGSRKALDIKNNSNVSLLFPWFDLDRQVIIGGKAELIPKKESAAYFKKRPRKSQIGAWTSMQSKVIPSRKILEDEFYNLDKKYADSDIPVPDFWGGYRIAPREIEFWQGGKNRLHDRFKYVLTSKEWKVSRLSP